MTPIDMVLHCPKCGYQHVDAPERHNKVLTKIDPPTEWAQPPWENPPHRSHLCKACGCIWRPANVPTNGVAEIQTRGENDTWPA